MEGVVEILASLERAPSIVIPLVREVPSEVLKRRPRPGKWSVHEHACHLAEVHPMIEGRLDRMLTETMPSIRAYNPDAIQEDDGLLKLDLADAMDRYAAGRERLVARLRDFSDADWQRGAVHEEYNRYSVFIMIRHLALHDMLHAYRIEELLLKKD